MIDFKRLLRTPRPYPDESFKGLLVRVAEENGYESPKFLLRLASGQDRGQLMTKGGNFFGFLLTNLSEMLNVDAPVLQDMANLRGIEGPVPKAYNLFGCIIDKYAIDPHYPKVCPSCLKETGYARRLWDLRLFTCCPAHGNILVDECPNCMKRISWDRSSVFVCKCGCDWRIIDSEKVQETEIFLSRQILQLSGFKECREKAALTASDEYAEESVTQTNPLLSIGLNELTSTVYLMSRLMEKFIGSTGEFNIFKMNNWGIHNVITQVGSIFENWPWNYFKFLDDVKGKYPSSGVYNTGVLKDFGRFYFSVAKGIKGSEILRNGLYEYLTTVWDGGYTGYRDWMNKKDKRNSLKYISREEAASRIGVSREAVEKYIDEGHLMGVVRISRKGRRIFLIDTESAKEMKAKLGTHLNGIEASGILGIGTRAFAALVSKGYVSPVPEGMVISQVGRSFERKEIDNLLMEINGRLSPQKKDDDGELIGFYEAMKKLYGLGIKLNTFVGLILKGAIIPRGKDNKKTGLVSFMFDGREIRNFSDKRAEELRDGRLTIEGAARLMKVKHESASVLVKRGMLKSEKVKIGNLSCMLVKRTDVMHFLKENTVISGYARDLGTSPVRLIQKLISEGLVPISGKKIDGGPQYWFRRKDVENSQMMKQRSSQLRAVHG